MKKATLQAKEPSIDLRKDAIALRRMLKRAVKGYAAKHANAKTSKTHPPVTKVDLWFCLSPCEFGASVSLNLDTQPGAHQDGFGWSHADFTMLTRDGWLPTILHVHGDGLPIDDLWKASITLLNGATRECDARRLTRTIGQFLVSELLRACEEGVFQGLPRARRCALGVIANDGEFIWPKDPDRGQEHFV